MRQYLLDSAPLAAYLNGRQVAVDLISPWITRREVATSILVYGEITEYLKAYSQKIQTCLFTGHYTPPLPSV